MDESRKLPAGKRNTGLVKGHALPFVCDLLRQLKDVGIIKMGSLVACLFLLGPLICSVLIPARL